MAVLCDFDDTIAVQNVAQLLLQRFGHGKWQELRARLRQKEINFREYQERAFDDVAASEHEMRDFVKQEVIVRPGFQEMWHHCQAGGIPLAIVSLGLDFYIDAVMEREQLSPVTAYTVETSFTPQGIRYYYPHIWDGCIQWGTCKCSILRSYRWAGYSVAYIGDGTSDFCPASRAEMVFARSKLAEKCLSSGVPYLDFQDFHQVLEGLQRAEEGGRAR